MAYNDSSVTQAVRGAVFVANPETIPTDFSLFTVDADTVGEPDSQFTNIGNMSAETLPSFDTSGGDSSTLATWNNPSFRVTYDSTTGTVSFSSVQCDLETIKLIYNAVEETNGTMSFSLRRKEQKKSVFVLWQDTNTGERVGILLPNTSLTYGSLPSLSGDNFVEYSASGNILESERLKKSGDDKSSVNIVPPTAFTAAGDD